MTVTTFNQKANSITQKAPSPAGRFLVGHMPEFRKDVLALFSRMVQDYPELVQLKLAHLDTFLVHDPELIRELFVKRASDFPKADINLHVTGKALGNGVLSTKGACHSQQRKLMQPAFHHKRLAGYASIMSAYTQTFLANWQDGEIRNIHSEMLRLTMFIVAKTLFDADMETMADKGEIAAETIAGNQYWLRKEFSYGFKVPFWLPTRGNREIKANNKRLRDMLQPIIDQRRQGQIEDKGDLLSILLTAVNDNGQPMNDNLLIDEVVTLFSAGHETTSNALSWTLYLLSQNPEQAEMLYTELDQVLDGRPPTFADLNQLVYTEMVLKESMRILPPVWTLSFREAHQDTTLGNYHIPQGSILTAPIYGIHRSPKYFPDPERFDPERFHPEHGVDLPRYAYLPFGAGPHVCIGAQFAMIEAKLLLAAICQQFRFTLQPDQDIILDPLITMGPKNGIKMTLEKRKITS